MQKKTIGSLGLTFPIANGLKADEASGMTGAFSQRGNSFLHATGFVIDPQGKVVIAVYSSGPIGRLIATDCLTLLRHRQQLNKKD